MGLAVLFGMPLAALMLARVGKGGALEEYVSIGYTRPALSRYAALSDARFNGVASA